MPNLTTLLNTNFGTKNKIINGNFDIWQRGTSFSIPSTPGLTYTADRWAAGFDGTGATRTISQEPFTLGQTDVPNEPTNFLRWSQTVAGTGATYNTLAQRIENVRTCANKTITVSFYAKAAASTTVSVDAIQFFGTGGTPSPSVGATGSTITVSTTWQKYIVTFSIPSISGKTLGTANTPYGDHFLQLNFNLPINSTFTFDLAQVQLEEGFQATQFEQRPIAAELSLCQRYYSFAGINIQGGAAGSDALSTIRFTTEMRRPPTATVVQAGVLGAGATFVANRDPFPPDNRFDTWAQINLASNGSYVVNRIYAFNAEL